MPELPTFDDVLAARERIAPHAHVTPVVESRLLDDLAGARLFFKCENLQRVGAFKFRGACNTIMSLGDAEAARGVCTHSSGNHAQAVALAAQLRGVPAYVVMPENAPAVKRAAVLAYGAEVTSCAPTLEARESTLAEVQERTGATLVHPFDDPRVIAGQGTAALELFEEVPALDVIMAPIGGGGLIAGTAITAAARYPETRVIAAEPEAADDAFRSLREGRLIPSDDPDTICDGLRTSLSERTFTIVQNHVERIVTVSEDAVRRARRLFVERTKLVIEPSSAVPLAAALDGAIEGRRIGILVTGGNLDLARLAALTEAG